MKKSKDNSPEKTNKNKEKEKKSHNNTHIGSSNAFEETENPLSRDADDISDEKLDDLLGGD